MRRIICFVWICSASMLVGCSTFSNWTASKSKKDNAANTRVAKTPAIESSEISTPKKVNSTKIQLAYAAWHEQSGNYQEARTAYLKVLEKHPKEVEAKLGLARIDRAFNREEEADNLLKSAFKSHPKDPRVLLALGQAHAAKEEWPEAIAKMKAAQQQAPYETAYEYHLAVTEARAGEIQSAFEHFTHSVGVAEANYNIGFIMHEQGKISEAENYMMKALKLKPDLKQAEAVLADIRTAKADAVQPASFNKKDRF